MHSSSVIALVAVLAIALPLNATNLVIRAWDEQGHRGRLTIKAGTQSCSVEFKGARDYKTCTLAVPPGTEKLVLERDSAIVDGRNRVALKGSQEVRIVDAAALFAPLRDTQQPFGSRVKSVLAKKEKLEQQVPSLAEDRAYVSTGELEKRDRIAAAEKRLGFKLPPEHADLLATVGRLQIDDSSFEDPDTMANAYDQMLRVWETPKSALDELPPAIISFLKESTILFTEVGDGYGALIYRPTAKICGGGPAFYYTHQDEMAQAPYRIPGPDGKCGGYADAIAWLFSRFILEPYDSGGPGVLLFNSSKDAFKTDLSVYATDPPAFKFMAEWN